VVGQDLEDVVADHPVEAGRGQRQRVLQVGLDEHDPGRPVLAGDRLGDRLGRPGQGARAQVEAGDQPTGDGRGGLGQGGPGAAAEVGTRSPGRAPSSPASQRCRPGTTGSTMESTSSGSPAMAAT
jgi:hypothetical protein